MRLADLLPRWARRGATVETQPTAIVTRELYAVNPQAIQANYEAARFSLDRSWLPGYVQDARQDIDQGQRMEMIRKARYFEKNHGVWQKVLDLIEVNVVGTGIMPTPVSSSKAFNEAALFVWKTWGKYADLTSRQTIESLQALAARAQANDGEIFIFLTRGEPDYLPSGKPGKGRPRVQLIETHRIVSAHLPAYKAQGYQDVDGILIDARGRPAFYVVAQDNDALSGRPASRVAVIPAEQIVHVFEPSRASQYHGIPLCHAVLHDLHDLDDLQRYEMLAAKDAAERANVVSTENGEIPQSLSPIGKSLKPAGTEPTSDADRQVYYEKAFGAKTIALKRGDKWEQSKNERPSAATQGFWQSLEAKFCKGIGISNAALQDYAGNWGGAALRGAVTSDNRFYEVRTASIATAMQQVYEYVIGDAIETGEIQDAPPDWREVRWQSPRRASVDIGRESAAIINELRAGVRTYRDVLGELGLDWQEVLRQRAAEEAFIEELAKEFKLDRSKIVALDPNERSAAAAASAAPEPAKPAPKELAP